MAYIVGIDRNQTRMVTTSLDDLIDEDNSVRVNRCLCKFFGFIGIRL